MRLLGPRDNGSNCHKSVMVIERADYLFLAPQTVVSPGLVV